MASSDAVHNIKMQRLFTTDEMMAIRAKRVELQAAYGRTGPVKLAPSADELMEVQGHKPSPEARHDG